MKLHDVEFEEIETGEEYPESSDVYVKSRPSGGRILFITGLVCLFLSLAFFAFAYLVFVKDYFKSKEPEIQEITYTQQELDKAVTNAADSARTEAEERVDKQYRDTIYEVAQISGGTGNYLRYLFPNDLIFTDGSRFAFVPFNKDLKLSTIDSSLLSKDEETGYISYKDPAGNVTSHLGIDISTYQKKIDWDKVQAAGIEFVIVRCGFRGYGEEGKLVEDSMFTTHMDNITERNIPVGVYFFTQATTPAEAEEEADMALSLIEPYHINGPVVIDVEYAHAEERTANLTPAERTDCVIAFCEKVKAAGYKPMIYSNMKYFVRMLEFERLEDYAKWYSNYNELYDASKITSIWAFNDPLYFPYEFDIWQYSANGSVDGIGDGVDLNILFNKWW